MDYSFINSVPDAEILEHIEFSKHDLERLEKELDNARAAVENRLIDINYLESIMQWRRETGNCNPAPSRYKEVADD